MRTIWSRWPSLVAATMLLVVGLTLSGSLAYQLVYGELPCPLCVIQRLCFLLACLGPLGILRADDRTTTAFQAGGFALTLFASLAGAAASTRQILLHIVPPDPGYGFPVMGIHLYSWALIVFASLILGSAVGLMGPGDDKDPLPRVIRLGVSRFIVGIAIAIAVLTFAMEGFAWLLPDDPRHYELLRIFSTKS